MRLIKNICNEYDVFRPRILGSDGLDGLTADRLFASIVYKNVYMGDYEKIRNAESALDDLYAAFRDWVAARAATARADERNARARLNLVSTSAISGRSHRLGERLQSVLIAKGGVHALDPAQAQVVLGGTTTYSWPELLGADFWRRYVTDEPDLAIIYRPNMGVQGDLSFGAVETLIGESLSATDWQTADRTEQRDKMLAATREQRAVAQASLTDALAGTDKLFEYDGDEVSVSDVASKLFEAADMVLELLRSGYIDENFTLYVTQFPNQGSAAAMNFILKAVQRNVMDIEYHFGADTEPNTKDIDDVIRAEGARLLQGKSVFNIEIFDRLFGSDPGKLDEPIRRLAANADTDREFIEAYINTGEHTNDFVARLSHDWDGILQFLIGDDPEARGLGLLDAALRGVDPTEHYKLAERQREAIVIVLPRLTTVTAPQPAAVAQSVARVFEQLGVRATSIAEVAEPLRTEMVARSLYEISRENLDAIVGGTDKLALDAIKAEQDEVYRYLLAHPAEYLAALSEPDPGVTVRKPENYADILVDVAKTTPETLTDIAAGAAEGCLIDDLDAFGDDHWPAIAHAHRFKLTVPLVTQYLNDLGLDDELLEYLSAARRFVIADGESGRLELAMKVVNARAFEKEIKIALLDSLRLTQGSIAASVVEKHAHALIPLLVSAKYIADDENAYTSLEEDEGPIKQALILASTAFPSYMSSLTLSPNELRDMAAPAIPDAVKEVLLRDYDTFEPTLGSNGAKALAKWIGEKGLQPEARIIVSLATKGERQSAAPIIRLLGAQAASIDITALRESLNALGGPFQQLTTPGRDRPKVPMIDGMLPVLERLRAAGIISNMVERTKRSEFEVFKRHA